MNWSDIGNAVKNYAPMVGMALSSPVGAAVAVGQLVANVFGTKATPEDVLNYINLDPKKAEERLQYEIANNVEFQKVCLAKIQESNRHDEQMTSLVVSDKESARENSVNINKSPVDNWIKIIMVISELTFFGACIFSIVFFKDTIDKPELAILSTIIGVLGKSLSSKDDFYWGSAFSRDD